MAALTGLSLVGPIFPHDELGHEFVYCVGWGGWSGRGETLNLLTGTWTITVTIDWFWCFLTPFSYTGDDNGINDVFYEGVLNSNDVFYKGARGATR